MAPRGRDEPGKIGRTAELRETPTGSEWPAWKVEIMVSLSRCSVLSMIVVFTLAPQLAHSGTVSLFSESFEGSLSQWSVHNTDAYITVDPLNAGNHVLDFARTSGSSSATSLATIHSNGNFTLSFDYLGLARAGSKAGDLGGTIGIVGAGNDTGAFWLGSTGRGSQFVDLIDDGLWHSYSATFASPRGKNVQLVLKDANGARSVAGDAYFDNIVLQDVAVVSNPGGPGPQAVPEPDSMALAAVALLSALALGKARRLGA
jgi:hypothetical protein